MVIATKRHDAEIQRPSRASLLGIVAFYATAFIVFGSFSSSPKDIWTGLIRILLTRDALLTDYIGIGGLGAAFVNAGLLTLVACAICLMLRAQVSGALLASLFLLLGFGLFGKNLLNVWPIIGGAMLYARFTKDSLSASLPSAFFGCALAPVFSEILFSTAIPLRLSLPLAIVTSLLMGFVLPPASAQLFKAHAGFSLYNIGFSAGVIGILVVALYKSYGFVPDPVMIWTSENNHTLALFLTLLLATMLLGGFWIDRQSMGKLAMMTKHSGQAPTDFIAIAGIGATLVNMGLCGFLGLGYILLVGADVNGPTIGGILTIVGFGAFGKHPANILPIMLGVWFGSLAKPWHASDPSIILAALFGTTLAPIAGRFGWSWGIFAGFIHSSAALATSGIHAGLNLYNNGLAAGLVSAVLVPVIIAVTSRRNSKKR
ncbi:DUF1576 domain-containing protein [Synechococcus sp. Tobar12-5m-g]|uniref:DUF1576 domain-containing protein n=1 Tax=unclassified Synechococcus TaxID=2626047 RepID=UPI0020CDE5DE|nr:MULTISPECIES: DUF1576 domain-containing protein [unclassified Synechococcus]MCP9771918.1 DUF1576 domain-containing protein [Synechococcus sp. Tobar12-5m-g]